MGRCACVPPQTDHDESPQPENRADDSTMHEIFSFGMCVRRRQKARDLTQPTFAQRVGCADVTMRQREGDVFRPSRKIAEHLVVCAIVQRTNTRAFS
jgi:DNA-binding XRE family transcriptional regulator